MKSNMTSPFSQNGVPTLAILGAGSRGGRYGEYVAEHPEVGKVVAVAEPREPQRTATARLHGIPEANVFADERDLLAQPRLADAVIIATTERRHEWAAVRAAELGYHILIEKPMASTVEECIRITNAARDNKVLLTVCHVLRYAPFYRKVKELLDEGRIGDLCAVQYLEGIAWWHYAHAFVRGNFANEARSSFLLLAKCCHDTDMLRWWVGKPCRRVASFGHLKHFRAENKPAQAADRCLDCVLADGDCPYSAKTFYFDRLRQGMWGWPLAVVVDEFTESALEAALRTGPYGKCVYACDNDVMDSQHVALEFDGNVSVSLTLSAFTPHGRRVRLMGSRGYLEGDGKILRWLDFLSGEEQTYDVNREVEDAAGGHGGGDSGLMRAFLAALQAGNADLIATGPEVSLESHLIAFAAERARREGRVVDLHEMGKGRWK